MSQATSTLGGRAASPAITQSAASLSSSIEIARVVLVIGLVFLHYISYPNSTSSPFRGFDPAQHQLATFVNSFVLFFFFSAVPLLSAISGWLFFGFAGDPNAAIARRIRGRCRSLLAPLIVWNAGYVLAALALYAVAPGNGISAALNLNIAHAGAMDYVNAILGLTGLPIGFQFWFVRDLFVTVLCTPLLWLLLRHAPLASAALLGLAWVTEQSLGIFIRTDVLFFFYLGALARRRGVDPWIGWDAARWLLLAYAVLMALRALAPAVVDVGDPQQRMWLDAATRLARPLGVLACWGLCLRLAQGPWAEALARWGGFAFFLHAAHFPLIAAVKYALWKLVPAETDAWMMAHYAASVAVTVALSACAAIILFRLSPALYSFLAGGRRLS
jgi:hypothetical protein